MGLQLLGDLRVLHLFRVVERRELLVALVQRCRACREQVLDGREAAVLGGKHERRHVELVLVLDEARKLAAVTYKVRPQSLE